MEFPVPGIGVLDNMFAQSEQLIKLVEDSGMQNFPLQEGRSDLETELVQELIDSFMGGINMYQQQFPHLVVQNGVGLRVIKDPVSGENVDAGVLSGALFLNTDVEGGDLQFPSHGLTIAPREGRMVLFPSNFMYPYMFNEIKNGYCVLVGMK